MSLKFLFGSDDKQYMWNVTNPTDAYESLRFNDSKNIKQFRLFSICTFDGYLKVWNYE